MFKRKKPRSIMNTGRELFWPSMGVKRSLIYLKYRLLRVSDTSHNIALGLAIGLGVSFTPLLGTHFIQAGILAFLFRANIFSAMLGTFIGNPWTFPFFWWAGFTFGKTLFGFFGIEGAAEMPEGMSLSALWDTLTTQPLALFMPWMMGGYILAVISIPSVYFPYLYLIKNAKQAHKKSRKLKHDKTKNDEDDS